ncbi:MAG: trypsin-like peptidase domain-containing protein [Candidatus Taylorbacteria bacterium]|nr:trypsin-like peptidase domain-containing protein [Candidatus Taylorbacteria bacterium]
MLKRLSPLILVSAFLALVLILTSKYTINTIDHLADMGARISVSHQNNNPLDSTPNYTFPKEALESDIPLPKKVRESFKSTIAITVRFTLNRPSAYFPKTQEFHGSGFITKDGVISARHIFLITIRENSYRRMPFILDDNNLPGSIHYNYKFYGTADINGKPTTFPLELIGMGEPYKSQDFAVFKAVNLPPQLKPLEFEENVKQENGDGRFDEDEIYYSSGRVPSFRPYNNDLDPTDKKVQMDFINYTFAGYVSAVLTDMPNNKDADLKKIYRMSRFINNVEPGYSGGPVFNNNGKVVGMTTYLSPGLNFSHAISATDLHLFIEKLKKEKRLK